MVGCESRENKGESESKGWNTFLDVKRWVSGNG
jgi:hypothetical protein